MYRRNLNKRTQGITTLMMTLVLLLLSTLMVIYSSQNVRMQTIITANLSGSGQAFEAAEAGLEYGIAFFMQNSPAILAAPQQGFIQYNINSISQSNGSSYSVSYTNPVANNYRLITITAAGRSSNGTSTRVITQQIQWQSLNVNLTISALGNVTVVGGSTLTNTITNINIRTGGSVTMNNGAQTFTSSGLSSSQGNFRSDVQQNVADLQNKTKSEFFKSIFNATESSVKSSAQAAGNYFTNGIGGDYSQALKDKVGSTIWIDQPSGIANLGQGVTIGSPTKPVVIIVDGDLNVANGVTIYGMVYATGRQNGFFLAGGAQMFGAIASGTTMNISNGFRLTYQDFGGAPIGGFLQISKVPGSWRDF